jgi:hypothetical protein
LEFLRGGNDSIVGGSRGEQKGCEPGQLRLAAQKGNSLGWNRKGKARQPRLRCAI